MLSEEDQAFIRQQDELARKYRQKAEKYGRITTVLAIITALLWLCNIALHATLWLCNIAFLARLFGRGT